LKVKFLLIVLLFSFSGKSQITTGGNASVTFTNGIYADLSPIVGYKIKKFSAGFSPFFAYSQQATYNGKYSYGARLFGQYSIFKGAFLHAEIEASNIPVNTTREWILGIPLGGGYEYEIAKNTKAQCSILYDVLLDKNSPKENPEIRGGIVYSF
jgi:hypothetical protein